MIGRSSFLSGESQTCVRCRTILRSLTDSSLRWICIPAETAALLVLRKKLNDYWGDRQRGQLTTLPERQLLVSWVSEARVAGARKIRACQEVGLSLRTLQRWSESESVQADARTTTVRPKPRNALSEVERQAILSVCNSLVYAHLPPSQIVPRLADQQRYLASESTFYRVLQAAGQQQHRGRSQHRRRTPPKGRIRCGRGTSHIVRRRYARATMP